MAAPAGPFDDLLATTQAFAAVRAQVRMLLQERMTVREFVAGERLLAQGAPGDKLMVLQRGSAVVTLERVGAPEQVIGFVAAGEVIGEMALLTKEPRTANVYAEQAGTALVLRASDFETMVALHPEVASVLTHLVADRLGRNATDALGGKRLDRYEIERCIGRGAMAVVYRARDTEFDRCVALKMMSHRLIFDGAACDRFEREADLLAPLDHPHIARLHRRFAALRTQFLALELCEGPSLAALLAHHRRLPAEVVLAIAGQIAAALLELHARGVIHRDLKPANVVLTPEGDVKLVDFGLAASLTELAEGAAGTHGIAGTPLYLAPELFAGGRADAASDRYAFGCLLHELALGELPFTASDLGALIEEKLLHEPSVDEFERRGLPTPLAHALATALAPTPQRRTLDLAKLATAAGRVPRALLDALPPTSTRERIESH